MSASSMIGRRRGRHGALALLVALGVVAGCTSGDGSGSEPGEAQRTTGTTEVVEVEAWDLPTGELAEAPRPPRANPNGRIVGLADRFLLVGRFEDAGANATPSQLFDPVSGAWTVLPPDPVDEPVLFTEVAPIEGGFVVLGAQCRTDGDMPDESAGVRCKPGDTIVLRYDLDDATWTELDPGVPDPPAAGTMVTDFGIITAWAGGDVLLVDIGGLWTTYDGTADAWARVEPVPSYRAPGGWADRCLTDDGFLAVIAPGREGRARLPVDPYPPPTAPSQLWSSTLLDADGTWSSSYGRETNAALEGIALPEITRVVCTPQGGVVLIGGNDRRGAVRFDVATNAWQPAARPPFEVGYTGSSPIAAGGVVHLPAGDGPREWVYDWEADAWTASSIQPPPYADLAVTADATTMTEGTADAGGTPVRYLVGRLVP